MEKSYEERLAIYKSTIFPHFKAMFAWLFYGLLEDWFYYKAKSSKNIKRQVKFDEKRTKYGMLRTAAVDRLTYLANIRSDLRLYRRD